MGVDVTTEVVIERPVEVVAAFVADPTNAPRWYENIESVRWVTPPPAQVGTQVEFVARFLGRRLQYTYEVVDLIATERLVMCTADGPFPMETTYEWTAVGPARCRMVLRNRGEPSGFSALATPLLAPAMRRANSKDLARLKELLEAT